MLQAQSPRTAGSLATLHILGRTPQRHYQCLWKPPGVQCSKKRARVGLKVHKTLQAQRQRLHSTQHGSILTHLRS